MPQFQVPSVFWEPASVDTASVYAGLIFLITAAAALILPWIWAFLAYALSWTPIKIPNSEEDRRGTRKVLRKIAIGAVGPILALLTAYVGYATFRTSNMMSALHYVSTQSNALFSIEAENPAVLCAYNWGEQEPSVIRAGCEDAFVAEDGRLSPTFDNVMLYVEETLLFFVEAKHYQHLYDANFYQGLRYWTADASEDWSGAFSYYFVMREMAAAQADGRSSVDSLSLACAEHFTGVRVQNETGGVCENYSRFMTNLGPARAGLETGVSCAVAENREELLRAALAENPSYCATTWWGRQFAGPRIAHNVSLPPIARSGR